MSRPSRVRVTGPLAAFAQGFAAELSRQGYRPNAAANQLQLLAHLSRWLAAKDSDATSLTTSVLNEFLAARRSQGYRMWLSPKALTPLVDYLRDAGFAIAASKVASTPAEVLLGRFRGYLIDTRGLAATTARGYVDMVRRFVATRVMDGDDLDWAGLKPGDITEFVLSDSRGRSVGSTKLAVTALRSLLGYLHAEGVIPRPINNVIPAVAGCRLAGLPRSLEPGEVERLLSACDRRGRTGRRNFAMLMLLVRLGLRAVEVRSLELGDIDWRAGELLVRGKGNRFERLPLPAEVGQALAAYLQRGRPLTAQGRTVFVRIRAPHRPLSRPGVTAAVWSAAAARLA